MSATEENVKSGPEQVVQHMLDGIRRQGYDSGYRQAVNDLLASLVWAAEEFLKQHPESAQELRKVIYTFEAHLERHVLRLPHDDFEGGLGI